MLRDYDCFETVEGYIFSTLGDVHPPDRYWSILKYVPGEGPWRRGTTTYRRVLKKYTVIEYLNSIEFLKSSNPSYVYRDATVDAEIIAPPGERITRVYRARDAMEEILNGERLGRLESMVRHLCGLLSDLSGVDERSFGVTGSILMRMYHDDSDIDLLIYGLRETKALMEALSTTSRIDGMRLVKDGDDSDWVSRATGRYPLSETDLRSLASRVINKGNFQGKRFTIFAVRNDPLFSYGDYVFVRRGAKEVRLEVTDCTQSLCTPSIYGVDDDNEYGIEAIWCYDKMLAGLLREGDVAEVRGELEIAMSNGVERWRHVLVGSYRGAGAEYIRLL
ncbi:MAG: hypothetical protein NZ920_01060 [Aigarchaeota archaeon]|nr:hypothetical protein [Aigarchaeota archaeon]MDW8093030.1 hypothetical protein [Nitrososphaerota archaeon]